MNNFLQTRAQIDECTQFLKDNNLIHHGLSCKDFDLREISPLLEDGNLLDMGADGSFILHNAIRRNIKGEKVGVDLLPITEDNKAKGAEYIQSDLMHTPFPDQSFHTITCLSVIEHSVDFNLFAKECGRLLESGGHLFVTCDYNPQKPDTSKMKLYSLDWNILDKNDVLRLVDECAKQGLKLTSDIDWTTNEMVINPKYCSPVQGVEYTFAIFHFVKE